MPTDPPPQTLLDELSERRLIDPDATPEALTGGRSNLVWKLPGSGKTHVLKLYRKDQDNPLFRNDIAAEIQCLEHLGETGMAPKLGAAGRDTGGGWVLYEHAPGSAWEMDTPAVAQRLGQLHTRALQLNVPAGCNGSAQLHTHGHEILKLCASEHRRQILKAQPKTDVLPIDNTVLIHGDPVPGNILVHGEQLTLIDWQCPLIGDPCEDLSVFLSPAMMQIYRGHPLSDREISAFLTAYPEPATVERYRQLAGWYHWRMSAYCLWRVEQGHADYAAALRLELDALHSSNQGL